VHHEERERHEGRGEHPFVVFVRFVVRSVAKEKKSGMVAVQS
jgi:hypothetical protein